jgi:D-serine deaminase-like pyridoxal phosphate-dependent protein
VDVGHDHGRTGVRSTGQLDDVARAVARARHLRLVGVAGYEGTIGTQRDAPTVARVDDFLAGLATALDRLRDADLLGRMAGQPPIVSAGGSVWFDRVAAVLGPRARSGDARIVVRSGCYVTHDHGLYARATPSVADLASAPQFRPALEVWARVVSRPEPGLLLVDAGRRDLSHDAGLPTPVRGRTRDGHDLDLTGAQVSALSDQHAFVVVPAASPLDVGDLVALGISHPCTTFDRWPLVLLIDDESVVVGAARTYF